MERKFIFTAGQYYHIFNRGVEKRNIFLDDRDRKRFQDLLYLANGDKPIVYKLIQGLPLERDRGKLHASIVAYALMSNHFHLVGREDKEGGLSTFMGKLSTSYSMYFNRKYERTGALLCHPFRARHIHFDDYFRWIMSYVHLNPLDIFDPGWQEKRKIDATKAAEFLTSFRYSSYLDYFAGNRAEGKILEKDALPIEISDIENINDMLEEFRSPPEDCVTDPW